MVRALPVLLLLLSAACGLAEDERDEKNRYIYLTIYDKAFEAYCLGEFDVEGDGRISRQEAQVGFRLKPSLAEDFRQADLYGQQGQAAPFARGKGFRWFVHAARRRRGKDAPAHRRPEMRVLYTRKRPGRKRILSQARRRSGSPPGKPLASPAFCR